MYKRMSAKYILYTYMNSRKCMEAYSTKCNFCIQFSVCCDVPILKRLSLVITVGIKLFST